jgi:hypothetical protein
LTEAIRHSRTEKWRPLEFSRDRHNAIRRVLPWKLSRERMRQLERIALTGVCEATGIRFERRMFSPYFPSLDRFDNECRYEDDNVRVVIRAFNHAKRNLSDDDFARVCAGFLAQRLTRKTA